MSKKYPSKPFLVREIPKEKIADPDFLAAAAESLFHDLAHMDKEFQKGYQLVYSPQLLRLTLRLHPVVWFRYGGADFARAAIADLHSELVSLPLGHHSKDVPIDVGTQFAPSCPAPVALTTGRSQICGFNVHTKLLIEDLASSSFIACARVEPIRDILILPRAHVTNLTLAVSSAAWKFALSNVPRWIAKKAKHTGRSPVRLVDRFFYNFGSWETAKAHNSRLTDCHGHLHVVPCLDAAVSLSACCPPLQGRLDTPDDYQEDDWNRLVQLSSVSESVRAGQRQDQSEARLDRLETRLDHLDSEVGALKADVGALKVDVGALKANVGTMQATMDAGFSKIDQQLVTIFRAFQSATRSSPAAVPPPQDASASLVCETLPLQAIRSPFAPFDTAAAAPKRKRRQEFPSAPPLSATIPTESSTAAGPSELPSHPSRRVKLLSGTKDAKVQSKPEGVRRQGRSDRARARAAMKKRK
jgi:hypothetical protein